MSYVDALIPADSQPTDLIERLRKLGVRDASRRVNLGPLDEATLNLARRVLMQEHRNLVLDLPRGRNDFGVTLGIYLQLLRLGAHLAGRYGDEGFDGSVFIVGLNVNVTERLRRIKVGVHSLSEALKSQRVRSDGSVVSLQGTISPSAAWSDGLLHLNTSLGWPILKRVAPGIVIIDRTSFRNVETLERALDWAHQHNARRVVVLNTLGDPLVASASGPGWLRWAWTPGLRCDLVREVGGADVCSLLSTNPLVHTPPRRIGVALYQTPLLTRLRRRSLGSVSAARRVQQPMPRSVEDAVKLLNVLNGLWGQVATANVWAAAEARGASVASLQRSLQSAHGADLTGRWGPYRDTEWPDLRRNVLQLSNLLTERNPRLDMLVSLIDWADKSRSGARLVVRTQSRAGAGALTQDLGALGDRFARLLGDGDEGTSRLVVLPYSACVPWADGPSVEFHLGVPPPWRRSALLSGEASEHIIALDEDELPWLETVVKAVDDELQASVAASAEALNLGATPHTHLATPQRVFGPVAVDDRGVVEPGEDVVATPALDLSKLFASFAKALTQVEEVGDDVDRDARVEGGGRPTLATLLVLEPGGGSYWLPVDGRAEVLIGTKYTTVATSDVKPGMILVIARGDTREDLWERLLRATHAEADVMAVSMLLKRFRSAMLDLYDREGSWDSVGCRLNHSGSTCRSWATGDVIAPDDVNDIRRVGWESHNVGLTQDRTWERIGAIAQQLRSVHRELGRLLSHAIAEAAAGRNGPNLQRLSDICGGIDPSEILEEFELRTVRSVGVTERVPAGQLRRLSESA